MTRCERVCAAYGACDAICVKKSSDTFRQQCKAGELSGRGLEKIFLSTGSDAFHWRKIDRCNILKFETKFTGDSLYRVGNQNAVKLDSLFKAKDGANIGTVSVTVESVNGTSASGTYSNNAIQFNGTGVVKVTIKDDDSYCIPTVLYLEVVDAKNISDGTSINTINGHGFFDVATNEFVLIDEFNAADYIGHSFVRQDGDGYATVELVSYSVEEQYTDVWSILTSEHYNCMLEGMWTVTAAEVENSLEWLMPYEIGEDMKYDEAKMQADIEKYGLYTYEDFADYCTYEQFVAFGFENFMVSVAKGYITWAEIEYLLSIHIQ